MSEIQSFMTTRRDFLKRTASAAVATGLGGGALTSCRLLPPARETSVRHLKRPVAIAMWDFSWLLRRHPGGGFEDWECALDGLAERGYNAVRIDVFPHLVGRSDGSPDQFTYRGAGPGRHKLWGNDVDITVNPREALLEFIPLCQQRNIGVDVSTWFRRPKDRLEPIDGFEGFAGVWERTLDFMEHNGLLKNALFIDLLNEYPHGVSWLKNTAREAGKGQPAPQQTGQEHLQKYIMPPFPAAERYIYKSFATRVLQHFRKRHPKLDFTLSLTLNTDDFHPERCVDFSVMDVMDMHIWFGTHPIIKQYDMGGVQSLTPEQIQQRYQALQEAWTANRNAMIQWMDGFLGQYAMWGRQHRAVVGNTEGWGCIGWDDIEPLDWSFIKQSADICVDLALKHNYKFICSSNFTHPHFKRLWADVSWHKAITARIRSGA